MRKQSKELITQLCVKSSGGWAAAIQEAQRQIQASEERVVKLKLAVKTFEEMIARGESFPGEEEEGRAETAA